MSLSYVIFTYVFLPIAYTQLPEEQFTHGNLSMYLSPYYFTSPKGNLWYPSLLEYTHSTCLDDQNRKDSPCTASLWQYKTVSKPNSNYTMKHKQYFIQEKDEKMLLWKKWALARLNVQGPQNTYSLCSKKKKKRLSACSPFMASTWHTWS